MLITKEELNNFMGSLHWIYALIIGVMLTVIPTMGVLGLVVHFFNSDIEYDVIDGDIPKGWRLHQILDNGRFTVVRRTWG